MMPRALEELLETASRDDRVLAVLLFGSHARGEARPDSDIDICLFLSHDAASRRENAQTRLDYIRFPGLDVHVYQSLPLYVQQRALKEGKVLLVKDEDDLYAIAFRTIRAWEDFRPFYLAYLQETANA